MQDFGHEVIVFLRQVLGEVHEEEVKVGNGQEMLAFDDQVKVLLKEPFHLSFQHRKRA